MDQHLPILQIVVPLTAAPLCILIRQRKVVLALASAATWIAFGISVQLMRRVLSDSQVIVYPLGGWAAPVGIEYRVDVMSAYMLVFVSAIGAIVLTFAPRSIDKEIPSERHYLFCTLYLLCLSGLLGICITGDLFNLFVFLEISSLSSYALISLGRNRRALTAALQYLVAGTIGATFILISIGLLLQMTGALNMEDLAERLQGSTGNRTVLVAFAFFSAGVSLKIALYPLHMWLPNAYTYAPSVVSAFIAATATKVSVYIMLRVVLMVFKRGYALDLLPLDHGLMVLSLIGIYVASIAAIFQQDIKRMLAYSSVSQIGYIVLGFSFATVTGLTGAIVHLLNHAVIKGGLFLAMGCVAFRIGSVDLDDMRGLGRRMPWTMFAWTLGGLGLIGIPVTGGFISKWYLLTAAMELQMWPVAVLVLLSSLLALAYVWRVVEAVYFGQPNETTRRATEAPLGMLLPTYVLIGASIFFGVHTVYSAGIAHQAAELLMGVRQ